MSFFCSLDTTIFYSVASAIYALFIILIIVCLVWIKTSLKSKQPETARTTVCEIEASVYDLPPAKQKDINEIYDTNPDFPEDETKKASTTGPMPSAPEFDDVTNEIYDGVPAEVYETIDDVTFKKYNF